MRKKMISEFAVSNEYVPMTKENMAIVLAVPKEAYSEFSDIIDELIDEGVFVEGRKKRLFSAEKMNLKKGVFRSGSRGFGFVSLENEEVYIPAENVNGALNTDTVLVKIQKKKDSADKKREGSIIRVIERGNRVIVGVYTQERGYGIITPDNDKLPDEIFVQPHHSNGALNGQKVVAKIIEYESPTTSLCAKVTEVLGFPYDFGVDVVSVIKSYEFPMEFSKKAIEETENISIPAEEELKGRLDLRDKLIITIDGEDTKDIDDAVSVEKDGDSYVLGVHIADVSNYVKYCTQLDKEAYSRGTSVYLVDRVIPMLPVKLSNGICSLNEGEIRLTMSAIMKFDSEGNRISAEFHKSVIKSTARMTYNEVRSLIEDKPKNVCEKYAHIMSMLQNMYELYLLLAKKTEERGSIDFNIPEAKAVFDKNGKTTDIVIRENHFAHKIIEEFMVSANSAVAEFLSTKGIGALYRVHEEPNKEKLENTLNFIYNKGYGKSGNLRDIMAEVSGTEQEAAFSTMLLRSMAKAKYSESNDGHYGLMLDNYCHFTSPIRRYPDLICHRALKAVIENDEKMKSELSRFVKEAGEKCSERENAAAMCERDTLDIKKAEYMENFVGQEFDGVISSVTGFGFFVMLPNTVEGIVKVESLTDDYYVFDQNSLTLTGERAGRVFTIGDSVRVKLVMASKATRRIDFMLLEGGNFDGRKQCKKNTGTKQKRSSRVFHRRKVRGRH